LHSRLSIPADVVRLEIEGRESPGGRKMRIPGIVGAVGLLLLYGTMAAPADAPDGAAAFERLKGLVGVWEVTQPAGKKATVRYELTAGGSALFEHYSDSSMGAGNEMITLYHLDSGRLLLTHYCMAGNQPRMLLKRFDAATGELDFDFLDATGLKSEDDGHMRRAHFRLVDPNRFESRWEFVENGKATFDEKQELTRVRSPK
jgi:hypothetical protein